MRGVLGHMMDYYKFTEVPDQGRAILTAG